MVVQKSLERKPSETNGVFLHNDLEGIVVDESRTVETLNLIKLLENLVSSS